MKIYIYIYIRIYSISFSRNIIYLEYITGYSEKSLDMSMKFNFYAQPKSVMYARRQQHHSDIMRISYHISTIPLHTQREKCANKEKLLLVHDV